MGDREFEKADLRNLPHVNSEMVSRRAGRDSYGDFAIGYVSLKRTRDLRTIKCNV